MLLPATLLLLAFNVQHSGSSRLFSPSFHLGDRPGYWFDGREILLQGNIIKDLSLLELWKYLFASHHFEINKKRSLFNKKISGGNQNRKKNNLFYCSPQSWQSIAKNTHEEYKYQRSENWVTVWMPVHRVWWIIWLCEQALQHLWCSFLPLKSTIFFQPNACFTLTIR